MSNEEKLPGDRRNSGPDEEKRAADNVVDAHSDGSASLKGEDVLALQDLDPALNMKMHLVNNVSRHHVLPVCWDL
jgi:hypothetical protein